MPAKHEEIRLKAALNLRHLWNSITGAGLFADVQPDIEAVCGPQFCAALDNDAFDLVSAAGSPAQAASALLPLLYNPCLRFVAADLDARLCTAVARLIAVVAAAVALRGRVPGGHRQVLFALHSAWKRAPDVYGNAIPLMFQALHCRRARIRTRLCLDDVDLLLIVGGFEGKVNLEDVACVGETLLTLGAFHPGMMCMHHNVHFANDTSVAAYRALADLRIFQNHPGLEPAVVVGGECQVMAMAHGIAGHRILEEAMRTVLEQARRCTPQELAERLARLPYGLHLARMAFPDPGDAVRLSQGRMDLDEAMQRILGRLDDFGRLLDGALASIEREAAAGRNPTA